MNLILLFLLCLFPVYPHTETDVQILGDVMWLENGHTGKNEQENKECLILTGAVVLNRMVSDDKWWHLKGDKTVYDVIYAKGQYASSTKEGIGKTDTPEWVYDLARYILNYGTNVPDYVIYQSTQSNLGTVWKIIDGEYFATAGGHEHEGDDFHPEVNGSNSRYIRVLITLLRNSNRRRNHGASVDNIRWSSDNRTLCRMDIFNPLRRILIYGGK